MHLAWVASAPLYLGHFWWWEFGLYQVGDWNFPACLFIIGHAIALFLLCALLFPDTLQDYGNLEMFFYDRRKWFFGVLALTYLLDVVDTLIKGAAHFDRFAPEYPIRTPVPVLLCLVAIRTRARWFHRAIRDRHPAVPGVVGLPALLHAGRLTRPPST